MRCKLIIVNLNSRRKEKEVREYLKQAREKKGYTQLEVANMLGISQNYYCDIENGCRQKELKATTALTLSEILNIPINDVLKNERELHEK